MVVGIWLVSRNELSIGALFAFRIIGDRVTGPLVQLVQTWQQFKIQSRNLTLAADVVDRPTEQTERGAANIPMPPIEGRVAIENVDFRYQEGEQTVLHNVSLDVAAGTFVGLVGGSGSGKSTLLKLLPRFYAPESGRIKIDGLDISKVELYSLRRQIGVVPQDSLLFDGTIKENLLMVKPDASSDELFGRPGSPAPTISSWRCPRATTHRWANGVLGSPAASANAWPWPERCCRTPAC